MKSFNQYITEKIRLPKDRFENQHNGFEYVDLDLPSGTLWATCNIGANKPEEIGDYFAWGETEPKKAYNAKTYKLSTDFYKYIKYSEEDNKTVLDNGDDPGYINMGGRWHLPTSDQIIELMYLHPEYVKNYNDTKMNGVLFTGTNGNKLFIPAGGYWGAYGHEDVGTWMILQSNELAPKSIDYTFTYEGRYGSITQSRLFRTCGTPCRCCFTK